MARRSGWTPLDLTRAYLAGGARLLQLRAKTLANGAFLDLATAMVEEARSVGGHVIVNDRADIARLSHAAGVHVGQEDLLPEDVRRVVGSDSIVGFSTHAIDQIEAALAMPISYFAVGPVFGTQTKDTGYERVGVALVRAAAERAAGRVPVVAIGGITLETAASVIVAGAAAVAVITDLLTDDPESRVRQYLSALA